MLCRFISLSFVLLMLAGFAGSSAPAADKPNPQEEDERKAAEAEDLANMGKDFPGGFEIVVRGRLELNPTPDGEKPAVLGALTSNAKTYLVKIQDESLRAEITKYDNKDVALGGKLRNGGKYLVVQQVIVSVAPPDSMRNPRGL